MTARALALQHDEDGPPGLLGDWAAQRGIELAVHRTDTGDPLPALNGQAFLVSLGSYHSPADTAVPEVAAEHIYMREAVAREIPVLGLCFGGQMLASVLGGTVGPAAEPEIGWYEIETTDPELVPPGPWLEWHYHHFTPPPGAETIATSPVSVQAFTHGRHLGVQFHPESTLEIVREWARVERQDLTARGIDPEQRIESGAGHAEAAAESAFRLFDAFWKRAKESENP